jgi:endogenous inhibitor of DNA gyrase (YacG/DUF329 family)
MIDLGRWAAEDYRVPEGNRAPDPQDPQDS